jgi:hypothetical protein
MKRRIGSLAILMAPLLPMIGNASAATLVGVLEEPQCKAGTALYVRPLFKKGSGSWSALNSEDSARGFISTRMRWTIGLDGRELATVETIDPGFTTSYPWTYPRDRLLSIVPEASPPSIPNKTQQFAGWCQAPHGRPLAAVVDGSVVDPDVWKPFPIRSGDVEKMFRAFKRHAGAASICRDESEKAVPFEYDAKDVEVLRGYRDRNGRRLITLSLKRHKDVCDGPADTPWQSHTFLVSEKPTYLGPGLTVVDAGDYDNDGKSEVLFWYAGYNEDGYVLFSGNTGQMTKFLEISLTCCLTRRWCDAP